MTPRAGADVRAVRAAGLAAIGCSLLVGASDVGLMGLPVSGREVAARGFGPLADRPREVAYASAFGALPLLGLMAAGGVVLWHGLRPAGPWRAVPAVALVGGFWGVGAVVHFSYGYVAEALVLEREVGPDAAAALRHYLRNVTRGLFYPLVLTAAGLLVAGSGWLAAAVLTGRTHFPRWFAGLTPAVPIAAALAATRELPSPVGGLLFPAFVHVATPVVFGVATWLLWDAGRVPAGQPSGA